MYEWVHGGDPGDWVVKEPTVWMDVGSNARSLLRRRIRNDGWESLSPEEKRAIPVRERVKLDKGDLEGWEDEVARRVAMHRETGGYVREMATGNTSLANLKARLRPTFERYKEYLDEGDLDETNAHVAFWVAVAEEASSKRELFDAFRELAKIKGKYIDKSQVVTMSLDVGTQGGAEELLARLEAKDRAEPLLPAQAVEEEP